MQLNQLRAPDGARRKRKRVGRGESSGHGKTATRGGKGQTARTGKGKPGRGFEGGQMPMFRRMPKRGFTNIFAREFAEVNLDALAVAFGAGSEVNRETLVKAGLAHSRVDGVRVLGRGEIAHALQVTVDHVTASAKAKIEKAGGTVTIVTPRAPYQRERKSKN